MLSLVFSHVDVETISNKDLARIQIFMNSGFGEHGSTYFMTTDEAVQLGVWDIAGKVTTILPPLGKPSRIVIITNDDSYGTTLRELSRLCTTAARDVPCVMYCATRDDWFGFSTCKVALNSFRYMLAGVTDSLQ